METMPLITVRKKNLVETINLPNAELENIDEWHIPDKFALNIDKTN